MCLSVLIAQSVEGSPRADSCVFKRKVLIPSSRPADSMSFPSVKNKSQFLILMTLRLTACGCGRVKWDSCGEVRQDDTARTFVNCSQFVVTI